MCLFNFVFKQTLNKRNYFSLVSPLLHTGILITSLTNKRNMKFNSKTRALIKHKPFQNPKNGLNMLRVGKSYDFHTKLLIFNVLTHTKILKSCLIIIVVQLKNLHQEFLILFVHLPCKHTNCFTKAQRGQRKLKSNLPAENCLKMHRLTRLRSCTEERSPDETRMRFDESWQSCIVTGDIFKPQIYKIKV